MTKPIHAANLAIRRTARYAVAVALTSASAALPLATATAWAQSGRGECVILQPLDGSTPYATDPAECAVKTSPASTFKIPHALIALETGVVSNALDLVKWDGTKQPFTTWEHDHSLDSAVKWSVVWFFQRTAVLIGADRLDEYLKKLGYAEDTFEGDVTLFWLNGDLVVSPQEQLDFLRRFARYQLPVHRQHVDTVKATLLMPPGKITNASGTHAFELDWPEGLVLRAKTGNTTVAEERVSWLVGHIETKDQEYVFVSRVRARESLPSTAGADLARRVLNSRPPGSFR